MKYYLTPKHPEVATCICITGNGFVKSCGDNVLIKITADPIQASQRYLWETICELVINLVRENWRNSGDTPQPKWHVVSRHCFILGALMFRIRPGNSKSLRVSISLIKWNVVNPVNPTWKDRIEDTRKSERLPVIGRIEKSTRILVEYSTGNGADNNIGPENG